MRTKSGTVTSSKMDKTAVITVHSYKRHPVYKKRYRVSKKYFVHDPENSLQEGQTVTIYETRPLSRKKRWTVIPPNTSKENART